MIGQPDLKSAFEATRVARRFSATSILGDCDSWQPKDLCRAC